MQVCMIPEGAGWMLVVNMDPVFLLFAWSKYDQHVVAFELRLVATGLLRTLGAVCRPCV